jgi:hypothetical protein
MIKAFFSSPNEMRKEVRRSQIRRTDKLSSVKAR